MLWICAYSRSISNTIYNWKTDKIDLNLFKCFEKKSLHVFVSVLEKREAALTKQIREEFEEGMPRGKGELFIINGYKVGITMLCTNHRHRRFLIMFLGRCWCVCQPSTLYTPSSVRFPPKTDNGNKERRTNNKMMRIGTRW